MGSHALPAPHHELLRGLNEQIVEISDRLEIDGDIELCCECSDCSFDRLHATRDDFDRVRGLEGRFLVRPDHVRPEMRVVERLTGCLVVEI
jgi:hypothetical protein